jgi:hypothetical protein
MRRVCFVAVPLLLGSSLVVLTAAPASAHATGGPQPNNYDTIIRRITPPLSGVTMRAIDFGAKLELRNNNAFFVTVLGYDGEPYLRVGPHGVYENTRSPAVFLNRTTTPTASPPPSFDARARPVWRHISSEAVARWHDHRAHWMGAASPIVDSEPHRAHVVIPGFRVGLTASGTRYAAVGDVVWSPGPSPWPWLFGALALAAILAALAVVRRLDRLLRPALLVFLPTFLIVEALVVVDEWRWFVGGLLPHVGASFYAAVAWLLVGGALLVLARRGTYAAAPLLLIGAVATFVGCGLSNLPVLWNAHVPNTLSPGLVRAAAAFSLGGGAGLIAVGAKRLREPAREPARDGGELVGATTFGTTVTK